MLKILMSVLGVMMVVAVIGCDNGDERLAGYAERATQRQAQQNEEMSRLNREVANGTRRAIEQGAEATSKALEMQKDLHEQHNRLETERQAIASERVRDSPLAPVLSTLGVLLVCCLPLVLCWKLLSGLGHSADDDALTGILIEELAADRSVLRVAHDERQALKDATAPVIGFLPDATESHDG